MSKWIILKYWDHHKYFCKEWKKSYTMLNIKVWDCWPRNNHHESLVNKTQAKQKWLDQRTTIRGDNLIPALTKLRHIPYIYLLLDLQEAKLHTSCSYVSHAYSGKWFMHRMRKALYSRPSLVGFSNSFFFLSKREENYCEQNGTHPKTNQYQQ